MKLPDYLLCNRSHRGETLIDLIIGTAILGIIMPILFNALLGILGQSAQTSKMIQANWVANSFMEEVMGFSFDDIDDFDSETSNEYGLQVAIRVQGAVVDEGAGTISIPGSPPVDPDYKQVQVTVSGGGLNENIVLKTLVAGEQNLSWIAGKVRNFSPVDSPRMVGNTAGINTPHGIVGLTVTVDNTDPLLETVTLPDNPATPAVDESGMYFIDNVPLGAQTITISGSNTFYDPRYPQEPVGPPRPPTTLVLLPGAALGNNRMDFISQAAVAGGLAVENQTRSVTVTTKDLAGADEDAKINNLLTVHATTWSPGAVFGTGGGAVMPSYGAGTNTDWMEDFRFIEGVSVNWIFHQTAAGFPISNNWVTGTAQYTQAQAQTAIMAGAPRAPWTLVTDPWGTLAVRLNYQDDNGCWNGGSFTWQTLISGVTNGNNNPYTVPRMTHAARGWDGLDNNLDGFPDVGTTISHGGIRDGTEQQTSATATINLAQPYHYIIRWTGIGEAELGGGNNYDNMSFFLDGTRISTASSSGGGARCLYMNLVTLTRPTWNQAFLAPALDPSLYNTPAPPARADGLDWEEGYYEIRSNGPLAAGSHTLRLSGTTGDEQYHYGSFYQIGLTFEPQRLPVTVGIVSNSLESTDGIDNNANGQLDLADDLEHSTIDVTFSEEVWTLQNTWPNPPSGNLVVNDFALSISASGVSPAVFVGTRVRSVTRVGTSNTYTIAYRLNKAPNNGQVLTVNPVARGIYDRTWDAASNSQTGNNTLSPPF
jgi:type II secretory pathway pseudopilin PulG